METSKFSTDITRNKLNFRKRLDIAIIGLCMLRFKGST